MTHPDIGQPDEPGATRALVVAAHPDDIDYGAAGTIASWTAAGIEVAYCIATRGDAGGFDDTPRELMSELREKEQRAAAAEVGVHDVTFLDYPDGRLYVTNELRRDITRQIRRVRPHRVIGPSPERDWQHIGRSHPDHLAVGEATLDAVYPDARNPFAHPELLGDEGLAAWAVSELWIAGGPDPDRYVDITDTFDRKIAALRAHASQTAHFDDLPGRLRTWLAAAGRAGGLPEGHLAESFRVVSTR